MLLVKKCSFSLVIIVIKHIADNCFRVLFLYLTRKRSEILFFELFMIVWRSAFMTRRSLRNSGRLAVPCCLILLHIFSLYLLRVFFVFIWKISINLNLYILFFPLLISFRFELDVQPERAYEVDVLKRGRDALIEVNSHLGLGFDGTQHAYIHVYGNCCLTNWFVCLRCLLANLKLAKLPQNICWTF